MALKRMALQLGMGTDIRGGDYTKAAVRAVSAAIRQNVLSVAPAFGVPREQMHVEVHIGVARPELVDTKAVAACLPYGTVDVKVEQGGMDTPMDSSTPDKPEGTIMANAAVIVSLDLPDDVGKQATHFKRIILEMGTGNDLYGEDYTKAAMRAVQDAIHHSSLNLFSSLGMDANAMQIELNLAAQEPEKINLAAVAATLPYGQVTAKGVKGGLNVRNETTGKTSVIVNAGIIVRVPTGSFPQSQL